MQAQSTLKPPTRTVYKCESGGKVTYSDEPCLGAKALVIEPTRGLNKSTGRELSGSDVARERRTEQTATAVRPLTGMTPAQFELARRRMNLPSAAQAECQSLDRIVPAREADERRSSGPELQTVQKDLLGLRQRQRELGC